MVAQFGDQVDPILALLVDLDELRIRWWSCLALQGLNIRYEREREKERGRGRERERARGTERERERE